MFSHEYYKIFKNRYFEKHLRTACLQILQIALMFLFLTLSKSMQSGILVV